MMDEIQNVKKEEDRLKTKYETCKISMNRNLDELISFVENTRDVIQEANDPDSRLTPLQLHMLTSCAKKVKEDSYKVALEHKELHTYVSKIGKAIERNFASDFSGLTQEKIFTGRSKELLNEAIAEHLLRLGHVDVADTFIKEARLCIEAEHQESFIELNRMIDDCKNKKLKPALSWAMEHREALMAKKSSVEFKLHKITFIDLIQKEDYKAALLYSKVFSAFPSHKTEIQHLMGCFAFVKRGLQNSPYADLLEPIDLVDVTDHLAGDVCSLLGLSKQSPLEVSITAGCIALPTLLQIKQVMQQRQVEGMWSSKEELPVEIELGRDFQFHSIFACPILRQQCGRTNPPMRLVCGHVISKDALQRLSHSNKLKCPYCPLEMDPREAKKVFF